MICFVGAHYLVIMKNPELKIDPFCRNKFRLFNDLTIQDFRSWCDVVKYCIEVGCLPTVLTYQQAQTNTGSLSKTTSNTTYNDALMLSSYEIEKLEQTANEQDSLFTGLSGDNEFVRE